LYIRIEEEVTSDHPYHFELIDMQGRLVVQERLYNGSLKINLKGIALASGIYAYRIWDDKKILDSGRVVIK